MKRLVVFVFGILAWSNGYPCSCGPSTLEERFESSPVIFRAFLTSINRPDPYQIYETEKSLRANRHFVATFEVVSVFKGDPGKFQFVFTVNNSGACGVDLELNAEYVFFASEEGWIALCGGSFRQGRWALTEEQFQKRVEQIRALQ